MGETMFAVVLALFAPPVAIEEIVQGPPIREIQRQIVCSRQISAREECLKTQ